MPSIIVQASAKPWGSVALSLPRSALSLARSAARLSTRAVYAAAGTAKHVRKAAGTTVTRGWHWLDPAVALAIAIVVACHAARLIRKLLGRPLPARQRLSELAEADQWAATVIRRAAQNRSPRRHSAR
jgi:hypothetical protein